jgi:hypothetical protein
MEIICQKSEKSKCLHLFFDKILVRTTLQWHHIRMLTFEWVCPNQAAYHYLHWCGYECLDFTGVLVKGKGWSFSVYFLCFELFISSDPGYFRKHL